jgi:hypothetical protein
VTAGGSRSLFTVVNVSTAELDEQVSDFSLAKQVNISYISEYNQTLLQEVKDSQAAFASLNASSFIGSQGVAEGAAALASIQNTAACGSRAYTTSNAFECLYVCTALAMPDCRKAAAYGYASVHSLLLSSKNPAEHANFSVMNTTDNAIVPAIAVADAQLKTALASPAPGFLRFAQCAWIGRSFVSIRTNLCGRVADTINVMWLCCGLLALLLMYLPFVFVKAEKRFKRINSEKAKLERDKQYDDLRTRGRRQSHAPLNSPPSSTGGSAAAAPAPSGTRVDYVSLDIPQNM